MRLPSGCFLESIEVQLDKRRNRNNTTKSLSGEARPRLRIYLMVSSELD